MADDPRLTAIRVLDEADVSAIADLVQQRGRTHCSGEVLMFDRFNLERAIREAVEASPRAAEWLPIETAPKNDGRVLVVLKPQPLETVGEITFGYWEPEADVWTRDETGEVIEPLWWMPVPASPRAGQTEMPLTAPRPDSRDRREE